MIIAPNHFSFMDHFFVGAFIRRRVRFMAKSQLFTRPLQWIYTHGGVFPVRRGYRDEDAFITANAILERGGPIVMYCEGGRSRTGKLSEQPKRGIGRLALESGATVVPGRDPRLLEGAQLEAPAVPEGHRPVRRADALGGGRGSDAPTSSSRWRTRSSPRSAGLYAGLDSLGRKGVARRLREARRAARRARATA